MIWKQLRVSAIWALVNGVFVLLIPRDPKNALFLGLSASRLAMVMGFALLAALAAAAAHFIPIKAAFAHRLENVFTPVTRLSFFKEVLPPVASLIILAGLYNLSEWFSTTDEYRKALLLRVLPVTLFAAGLGVQVLALELFRSSRRRWGAVIALTIASSAASRLLQGGLLNSIVRPYVHDPQLVQQSQITAALAAFLLLVILSGRSRREQATWGWITVLLLVLYLIQWATFPEKYWESLRDLALAGPLIVFGGALVLHTIFDLWDRVPGAARARLQPRLQLLVGLLMLPLIIPSVRAASIHSQKLNYSPEFTDQAEYLLFARNARLSNFNTTGDNNRMPAYPYLLALFYRPEMSDTAFFELGKNVNIGLSVGLLVVLFLFLLKYMSFFRAALFTALAAFSLFIFKAPYIQAESIYYLLAFIGFVLLARLLIRPEPKLAITAGVVLGLAHLTKASVLPGLILFAGVFLTKEIFAALRQRNKSSISFEQLRPTLIRLGNLGLVLVCFLAVIFPYIHAMKERFGHYFYNVNTTFYVWYDDNFQAIAAEKEHHFADEWPSHLPLDELPGPARYFREHTPAQILERIKYGLKEQINNLRLQYSVTNYHLSYLAILGFVFLADIRRSLLIAKKYRYAVMFSIMYFLVYLAAFVWYSPISPERRFTYGLLLPFLFSVFIALHKISEHDPGEQPESTQLDIAQFSNAAHFIIFLTLPFNIYFVLVERMLFDRYGS